ncbi:MerR family transcriptional regulator [Thermoflavimicrobium dichotomicum]|uniref:DNA binding domain-containing protein, excisionase family n=1 Tax=Thermoflavimicrobium dichotomicum TaxID=46223 RepID=A0A1I3LS66_9BACL|nr:MerR family transcriptional regulator [Thermoflavimicrobium dichotomicum]SFI87571.1 DNA binding domain-containing protein, excisionase family [Thermoflavimicrobium dichotomicum]
MNQLAYISTREAAERLQVHARTIRKWIDTFEEYICPEWNERGHYLLTEESLLRLADIKERLQEPNKSMRQVREDLFREGKIAKDHDWNQMNPEKTFRYISDNMENMIDMVDELFTRIERMEGHLFTLFDAMESMEQQLAAVSYESIPASEIHKMFDDIRKKQDQLKMELRNANFTQRLISATRETSLPPRKKKKSFLFF